MSTNKQIFGDYYINTVPVSANTYSGNIHLTTDTVKVHGNLDVTGNLTYINVTELNIQDPFIILNSSNTSSYSANTGVLTHRTSSEFAGIRWSETANSWQVSGNTNSAGDSGSWANVLTSGTSAAGANTEIQFNDGGDFGANANFTFDQITSKMRIDGVIDLQGHQIFGNVGVAPANVANSTVMYHTIIGGGNTGIYTRTTESTDELVAKRRSIAFSLIF